jgi:hypothetical protein
LLLKPPRSLEAQCRKLLGCYRLLALTKRLWLTVLVLCFTYFIKPNSNIKFYTLRNETRTSMYFVISGVLCFTCNDPSATPSAIPFMPAFTRDRCKLLSLSCSCCCGGTQHDRLPTFEAKHFVRKYAPLRY